MVKHPHSVLLRKPPLPLPGGEEAPIVKVGALFKHGFLSPGQGERWSEGPEWGCFSGQERASPSVAGALS
ncbi:hypothetical protein RHIZO_03342 [Rhizobiaceae bacterium]|nr:hypothetical protein RHIZO_03342 [Rhizobiaceae bacterium]